jgi:predicted P-loop ATPase
MDRNVIPITPSADAHARAETERKRQLFAWADRVLTNLGYVDRIARAVDLTDLRKILFDADAAELAIREALHPASGKRADHFIGLRTGALKRILQNRFDEMKKDRSDQLRHPSSGSSSTAFLDWTNDLKFDKDGGVRPILSNLILYLRHHPEWEGVLGYDEFAAQSVIRKRPPWGDEAPDAPWTDHHEALVRVWFQREDINAAQGDVGRAVQVAARDNPFHPVREYLESLVWDGVPRIEQWLISYLHADDTPYMRAIGPRFLISAVARIYKPGCQVDHAPVLEGPQGQLKSSALRALAVRDNWFTDRLSPVSSKDAAQEAAGVWIIEIAEMDALFRASGGAKKSYLTRRVDRFRPPYGKHQTRHLRQCVFAGTINPELGGYLTDATGARRLWPFACHGMIDQAGIACDRDQLWAEAIVRYKAGAPWWLETPALEALATAEQKLRFKGDVWAKPIKEWIGRRDDVSLAEVAEHALRIQPQDLTHSAEIRVAKILDQLGFKQVRARKGNQRSYRYQR